MRLLPMSLAISCFFLTACSTGDAEDAETPKGPSAAFHGEWNGSYKKSDKDGLTLKQTKAEAKFVAKDDTTGTFNMTFPEENDSVIKGDFQVFNMTKMILDIKESNFSSIGLANTVISMNFELNNKALILSTDDIEITMVRSSSDPEESEDANKAKKTILGRWQCIDKAANNWDLNIEDTYFNSALTGAGSNYINLNGDVVNLAADKTSAILRVTNAPYQTYKNRLLHVTRTDEGLAVEMTANETTIDQFTCRKS